MTARREVLDAQGPEVGEAHGKISMRGQSTVNILLEGAAWNFINIRRTAKEHNLPSEASFRFSRGVHPALAETGVRRGLQLMASWAGGHIAPGLVDEYPLPPKDPFVTITSADVTRLLGIELSRRGNRLAAQASRFQMHGRERRGARQNAAYASRHR